MQLETQLVFEHEVGPVHKDWAREQAAPYGSA